MTFSAIVPCFWGHILWYFYFTCIGPSTIFMLVTHRSLSKVWTDIYIWNSKVGRYRQICIVFAMLMMASYSGNLKCARFCSKTFARLIEMCPRPAPSMQAKCTGITANDPVTWLRVNWTFGPPIWSVILMLSCLQGSGFVITYQSLITTRNWCCAS